MSSNADQAMASTGEDNRVQNTTGGADAVGVIPGVLPGVARALAEHSQNVAQNAAVAQTAAAAAVDAAQNAAAAANAPGTINMTAVCDVLVEKMGSALAVVEFCNGKLNYIEERINHTSGDRHNYWQRVHTENRQLYEVALHRMHHEYEVHMAFVQRKLEDPGECAATFAISNDEYGAAVKAKLMEVTMEQ